MRLLAATLCFLTLVLGSGSARGDASLEAGLRELEANRPAAAETHFRASVRAQPDAALPRYYLGLALLRQKEPARAARELERALALDPALPGARTSLGIAWYEAGRERDAERELKRAVRENARDADAHLFLGLARWRSGDREGARVALQRARELERDPQTAAETAELLAALERGDAQRKPWSLYGGLATEYDDDVTQDDIDSTSGEKDFALVIELGGDYAIVDRSDWFVEAGYDFYQSLYADESDFNLQSHTVFADIAREFGALTASLGPRATLATLDGDDFLELLALRPSLGWAVAPELYIEADLEVQDRDFDDSRRDADRLRYGLASFVFPRQLGRLRFAAHRIEDDADADEFDFQGYEFTVGARIPLPNVERETRLEAGFEYERRDYDDITPSIGRERDDRRTLFALGIVSRLNELLVARFDWERTDADSNLPSADYRQNILRLRVGFEL